MSKPSAAGQFVWHDLMTTDREAAINFYSTLFDWTLKDVDMGERIGVYPMIHVGETGIGGVVPLDSGHGIPSHWITYVSVEDVDAACKRAKDKGGKVANTPFDIPNVGRTAVVQDPGGAYFSPFKGSDPNWEPASPGVGMFAWHELMTTDIEKVKPFYTDLIGWGLRSQDMGPAGTYWLFRRDDKDTAGAIQMPPDAQAPSNWLPYVGVKDVVKSAGKAESLGAQIWVKPTKIGDPVNVHFAVLGSPDGSMFGLIELPG